MLGWIEISQQNSFSDANSRDSELGVPQSTVVVVHRAAHAVPKNKRKEFWMGFEHDAHVWNSELAQALRVRPSRNQYDLQRIAPFGVVGRCGANDEGVSLSNTS